MPAIESFRPAVRRFALCLSFLILPGLVLVPPATASPAVKVKDPNRKEPLQRVGEMLEWVAREQQMDGGWHFKVRLPLEAHVHQRPREEKVQRSPSYVTETAMAALALVRAGNTADRGAYRENVRRAAGFLYSKTMTSDPAKLELTDEVTPFSARVGPHVDTFLTLHFFTELRDPASGAGAGAYDGAIERLVGKMQDNQRPDGGWGEAAHAPLLGHALGIRALEMAVRHGAAVEVEVIARAEQYGMSEAAEKNEWATNNKWRTKGVGLKPRWMENSGVVDDEPINHELYVMAARLSILHQADETNKWTVQREVDRLKAKGTNPTNAELRRLRDTNEAAKKTRKPLEDARQTMRQTWIKVHKRDVQPSPAPLLFTGEDFLAALLTVDAMAQSADVQKWYPPVVQRLMVFQDLDGGLRTNQHIDCYEKAPKPWKCICRVDLKANNQMCPAQKSWASRDRVFTTAAGLMILAADTPYRKSFLDKKAARR